MPVEPSSLFTQVIQEHLELKRRNAPLEQAMPIGRYKLDDTFSNHPLFKSEEQARLEETGALATNGVDAAEVAAQAPTVLRWPGEESAELAPAAERPDEDTGLWGRSRDFDWGD